jgi:hypothetical protein
LSKIGNFRKKGIAKEKGTSFMSKIQRIKSTRKPETTLAATWSG